MTTHDRSISSGPARPYIDLFITMFFFASAFTSSKVVVEHMPHGVAAALRFGGGALVLLALTFLVRSAKPLTRGQIGRAAAAGFFGVFLYNVLFFWGISLAPAIDGSLIAPVLSPLMTLLILVLLKRETLTLPKFVGLGLGVLGASIFIANAPATASSTRLAGDVVFIAAAVCWSVYGIVAKRILADVETLPATAWATASGAALLVVWSIPSALHVDWSTIDATAWANVVFLAVGPTAIAYYFYSRGLRRVSPTVATVMMFSVPVMGSIFAYVFLAERIILLQGLAAVILITGAIVTVLATSRSPSPKATTPTRS
ncbi:DMT family transporter [Corynebacterium heidelbergense]|uniref:EamA family transporter n=1 Tax=Corynebacterium heidelbergense TaxID=2055947 RepID=A0A364V905_9CORY|nr:DMT family transporter [Corynebacterium heidelbergense]RAV33098.1 EamA family transporter [Corynebacterium heidelbergense]